MARAMGRRGMEEKERERSEWFPRELEQSIVCA